MPIPAREHLAALVAGDHLREALDILLDRQLDIPDYVRNQALVLSGQYEDVQKATRKQTRDSKELNVQKNHIRDSLLSLAKDLPEDLLVTPAQVKKAQRRKIKLGIAIGVYAIVAGFIYWASVSPKPNIQAQLEVQLSRLAFYPHSTISLFNGEKVASLGLQNFRNTRLYADSLTIDADFDGNDDESTIPEEELFIQPLEGISSVSLRLSQLSIEEFNLLDSALVTITHIEDDPQRFRVQVEQKDTVRGRLNYANKLELSGNYLEAVRGLEDLPYWEEPVKLTAHGLSPEAKEVNFAGYPEDFNMELELIDSCVQNDIIVKGLEFLQLDNIDIRSSILGGKLLIQELDKPQLREIDLKERDRLDVLPTTTLNIQKLSLRPEGIFISANGRLKSVHSYVASERKLRNPSRIEWYWTNRRWELSVFGVLLLVFLVFLPGPIGDKLIRVFQLVRG